MIDIEDFWETMSETYGQKWTGGYGSEPTDSWRAGLSTLTDAQVRHGYRTVIEAGSEWPPTLPEFIVLARGGGNQEQRARDARLEEQDRLHYDRKQAQLPAPDALMSRTSKGRKWLAFCLIEGIMSQSKRMTSEEARELLSDDELVAFRELIA